ncbi:MAG: DUF4956 domain-containing protein [Actinomycetota bacterium]
MSLPLLFAIDLVAIGVLILGLYFPRHRRRDLVAAYLGVNIGVLAVAAALSSNEVGAGLGIGLFGVLSIIRLRSAELDQEEIAYYFASLALGLLGGLAVGPDWLTPVLMASVVAAVFIGDHPRLFAGYRRQVINLGVAITDEAALIVHLEQLLGATVHRVKVRKVDLVDDTTNVEVRYRLNEAAPMAADDAVGTEHVVGR